MSKIYCGEKEIVPKGYDRFGSMKECVDKKQIRRYGRLRADKVLLKERVKKKGEITSRADAIGAISKIRGKIKNLKSKLKTEEDKIISEKQDDDLIKKLKKELADKEKEYDRLAEIAKKFDQSSKKGPKKQEKKVVKIEEPKKIIKTTQKVPASKLLEDFTKLYEISEQKKKQKQKIEEPKKKVVRRNPKFKGGKLKASLLRELFLASKEKKLRDVQDYKIDKELSTKWVQVYHNPKDNWTIVVHRGSDDLYDAWVDVQLAVNYKNNPRFKESERIEKEAEKKYDPKRMSIVGSSLGAVLAEDHAGENVHEIITSGKPVSPADLLTNKNPKENQYDVRTPTDIISFLKPFQPHENDLIVKSINPYHPVKSHMGNHVMEAVMEEKGDDYMIGKGKNYNKMKVNQLKAEIKKLRKIAKVPVNKYPITKRKKKELIEMINELNNII